jgi:folate-binding protein YgfZ
MIAIFEPKKSLNWTMQQFSGPDARDFLHRLTTVNLHRLGPGDGSLGFFLTAIGRIRAQFFLGCTAEDAFVFEYDSGKNGTWSSALAEAIDQFTFAERQALSAPSSKDCLWVLVDGDSLPGREKLEDCTILDRGSRDFGLRWFSVWGDASVLASWRAGAGSGAALLDWPELDRRRIERVRPWVDHELTPEMLPLELGLYDGIAENKGCYPGQETVERLITQGAPPRRIVRVALAPEFTGAPEAAATSWYQSEGLAIVRKNLAVVGQKLSISGHGEATVKGCSPDAPFDSA